MSKNFSFLYFIVLFSGMFIITLIETLSDIHLGLYHGLFYKENKNYFHAIIPALPWVVVSVIAYFSVPRFVYTVSGSLIFLALASLVGFITSQILYKYPNVILLFFCVVFSSIVATTFLYKDTFQKIEGDIQRLEKIQDRNERTSLAQYLEKKVDKLFGMIKAGTIMLLTTLGTGMIIVWTTSLLKKSSALRAELYSIIIAIGFLYAFSMIFFWLFRPLQNYFWQLKP